MRTMPSSRSAAALSMAAWMAALSSVLPSPAAPVSETARGSSGRVAKADVPGCAVALATAASRKAADRRFLMVFGRPFRGSTGPALALRAPLLHPESLGRLGWSIADREL